tara:strand:+ start:182 stop:1435 length:1254 start_codon:yes stop_codon:yes gene_type:complete
MSYTTKKKLINISFYLICFLPIAFVTGPLIPDLIIVINSLIFLYLCFKENLWHLFKSKIILILLFFYSIIVISSLSSEILFTSLKSSVFFVRFIIFAIACGYVLNLKNNSINILRNFVFFTIVILVIDGLIQYFFGVNLFGMEPLQSNVENYDTKITSFFGEDEILGSYLTKILPIFFALFFIGKDNINIFEIKKIIFVFLLFLSVFITGERAAFIHLIMFFMFFFIFSNLKKKLLIFFSMILILILAVSFISTQDKLKKHRMLLSPISALKNGHFSPMHESHYLTGLNMYKDKFIIGHGPKAFRFFCGDEKYRQGSYPCSNHPHNTYIQLLAETGTMGFLIIFSIFIFLCLLLFKNFFIRFKNKKNYLSNSKIAIISGLLIYLWPISPHGNFFNNWLSGLLFFQLSIHFYLFYQKP